MFGRNPLLTISDDPADLWKCKVPLAIGIRLHSWLRQRRSRTCLSVALTGRTL